MSEVKMPEPYAWASFNMLTKTEYLKRVPVTSMQAGVYQHTKLFSQFQMEAYAAAKVREAMEQAATVCSNQAYALDNANNLYVRYEECLQAAARIRALSPGAQEGA